MRWSLVGRTAAVVTGAVTAAVLVGAAPASADIIVDSAVCLNGASATMVVHPKPFPQAAQLEWTAVLPQPYCRQANAQLLLTNDSQHYAVQVSLHGTDTVTGPIGTTLWKVKVQTSQGGTDLASVWVTITR
jgi:hypothetical protein